MEILIFLEIISVSLKVILKVLHATSFLILHISLYCQSEFLTWEAPDEYLFAPLPFLIPDINSILNRR